jgi:DNA-binding transcriptional MerR regulator
MLPMIKETPINVARVREIQKTITLPSISVKQLNIASRTVHHWKEKNLLFDIHQADEKNNKLLFSISEYFWIRTIQKCRAFGVSIEDIEAMKSNIITRARSIDDIERKDILLDDIRDLASGILDSLTESEKDEILSQFKELKYDDIMGSLNEFDALLMVVLVSRKEAGIYLELEDGKVKSTPYAYDINDNNNIREDFLNKTHIYISFMEILRELGMKDYLPKNSILTDFEEKSVEIIKELRTGKIKEIQLSIDEDGKIKRGKLNLKKPINQEEVQEYERKYVSLKSSKSTHHGEVNFFDFCADISFKKIAD